MKIITFFKRLFNPAPEMDEQFEYGTHCLISFAINRYGQSPLRGCINDQEDIVERTHQFWPQFSFRLFKDAKCTWQKFEAEILKAFEAMTSGYLVIHYSGHGTYKRNPREIDGYSESFYFINGAYADYQVYELLKKKPKDLKVVFILDCCFSTGITIPRVKNNPVYRQPRFYLPEPLPENYKISKAVMFDPEMDWIVFAACGERETANDALIANRYNGAFTYYFKQIMRPGVFFINWQRDVEKYLPTVNFQQTPSLTGKEEMMNLLPYEL